ncbi:MAG: cysteine desulfurase-like protein [Actinomycetota bacterium]|nr:cysteine desulfurase-like protein [Actinomycetota bacterium]
MDFDVDRVRRSFPALEEGAAHFDGPGGSQVPRQVAEAVAATLTSAIANRGSITAAERRADQVVAEARAAVADLLGADPGGVVFGRSMTQLTYDVSRAMAKEWGTDDEVVVTRLDHDANIRPWLQAAERVGATVRWADFDRETAELPVDALRTVLSPRTRLVAVTGASNLIGTRPDIEGVVAAAHDVGALVYVDGVHLTPHAPVDMAAIGADFFACSPYKFFGPHLGALVSDPRQLEALHPDKLMPASEAVPERFEAGTLPYELLTGVTATVDFIASLASPAEATRRERVVASMLAVEEHENRLLGRLTSGLAVIGGVTMHGQPVRRTPTLLFSVEGVSPQEVHEYLATRGVNAPGGSFYALEAARWLGLGVAGAVRAGLAPYTNEDDVDRLIEGVAAVAR